MKQWFWAISTIALFSLLWVLASPPEVLVLRDGTRMEVEHFELRGTSVVFATTDGKLQSLPLGNVDLVATAKANGLSRIGLPAAQASTAVQASTAAQANDGTLSVADGGSPATGVDVFLLVNQGKRSLGTTDSAGQLPFDPALLTGKVRVTVTVQECPETTRVYLVSIQTDDACKEVDETSDEPDCRCDVAGAIWWGSDIQVDISSLTAEGAGSSIAGNPWVWVGVGGAAAGTGIIVGTGGDDDSNMSFPQPTISTGTTPLPTSAPLPPPMPTPAPTAMETSFSGTYDIEVIDIQDPAGHFPFIGNLPGQIDIFGNNGNFRATGQQPWVRVDGNINMSSGNFDSNGRGNVAGRSGIQVRFSGRIEPISPYRITGWYEMGVGGGLPTGQPIRYRIDGHMR